MAFSLIRDRWIPIRYADGTAETIRPSDLPRVAAMEQRDPNLADFAWGRADLRVASYELLIGLLAVAFPPENQNDWSHWLTAPADVLPDSATLDAAFEKVAPYFELDGDGPRFLQDLEPLDGETLSPDALLMDAPGANTLKNGGDLFVKGGRTPVLSRAAASIALFALQAFAPSGGAGHRTSMRGGGPMTTLVVPKDGSLWQRVWANVPSRQPLPADLTRIFPWAAPTYTSQKNEILVEAPDEDRNRPWGHPLQAYFGMPRRIRLVFEAGEGRACALTGVVDDRVVAGFMMKSRGVNYGPDWRHPLTPYYTPKSGTASRLPLHPKSSRFGYRQWAGLLYGERGENRAECVAHYLNAPERLSAAVHAAGYVTDNMRALDFLEADAPLILASEGQNQAVLDGHAEALLDAADKVAFALRGALRRALEAEAGTTVLEGPVEDFWAATEKPFRDSLQSLAGATDDPDRAANDNKTDWRQTLSRVALAAFDRAVPPVSLLSKRPAEQEAMILARKGLGLTLNGYGASGGAFFDALGIKRPPRKKDKEDR